MVVMANFCFHVAGRWILLLCFIFQLLNVWSKEPTNPSNGSTNGSQNGSQNGSTNDFAKLLMGGNEDEALKNRPFIESKTKIRNEDVAGLIIREKNIVYLSYDKHCYSEPLIETNTFSDINSFKKYVKLISVDLSGVELTKERIENIQKFLPKDLSCLSINCCNVSQDLLELIADIFRKRNDIKHITLRLPSVGVYGSDILLASLAGFSELVSLNITLKTISKKSCNILAKVITSSEKTLQNLSLCCSQIADSDQKDGGDDEDDEEEAAKPEEVTLREISAAIEKLQKLKRLEISIISAVSKDCSLACSAIKNLTDLISLKIFFGNLSLLNDVKLFERSEELGESLANMHKLIFLDLSCMNLPKDAMQVLVQQLAHLKKLRHLDLSGNQIDSECAEILVESIGAMEFLETLALNKCSLSEQTFPILCKSLGASAIKILYAGSNDLKGSIKGLPIKTMDKLRIVDFSSCGVSPVDAITFIRGIIEAPWLQMVIFANNDPLDALSDEEKKIFRNEIEDIKRENRFFTAINL
jgi:hypothetical protein